MPRLHIRDINIYYEIAGEGEPLLLIHGFRSSMQMWRKQIPVFSPHYKVVTFDLRGHGKSDKPLKPYSIRVFAADIVGLMKALELPPAHVVGFSMGGMIGIQLCLEAPESVKSLVVVNSPFTGFRQSFRDAFECLKHFTRIHFAEMWMVRRTNGRQSFAEQTGDGEAQAFAERLEINHMIAQANSFWAVLKESLIDKIGLINCPTLFIASDNDYVPVSVKSAYISRIPCAELVVIPNSGHSVPAQRSETFNSILMGFLSQARVSVEGSLVVRHDLSAGQ